MDEIKNITIITINYNNLEGLKQTMSSVINQTYKNFEYVVIDGGSSDGSKEYIENQANNINYWISETDKGIYNAMNKGIKVARGQYLLFLNSGDYFISNNILEKFVLHPNFNGDIIYGNQKVGQNEHIPPKELTPFFFVKNSLPHQATFFKKELFNKLGLYNESYKVSADREFCLRCLISNKCVFQHISIPVIFSDPNGISRNPKYVELVLNENDQICKENLGIYYKDYMLLNQLNLENIYLKNRTFKGILNKIKQKIDKIKHILPLKTYEKNKKIEF